MHQFFLPDLSADLVTLDEDESKHAIRVLRLQQSDEVILIDGKGTRANAVVESDHAKRCVLRIVNRKTESTGRNFKLHIAVAPTKSADRIEWFLEKAVEIGIDKISLIECEHSERSNCKIERLEKIAIAAMKQSQQSWLPQIEGVFSFGKFLQSLSGNEQKFIAHLEEGERKSLKSEIKTGSDLLILIGPEGDFSQSEIDAALANGFTPVSLGETRLRTETAALYAVMTGNLLNS